jgi:hypothetical protein
VRALVTELLPERDLTGVPRVTGNA